jgi:hypothetical protein
VKKVRIQSLNSKAEFSHGKPLSLEVRIAIPFSRLHVLTRGPPGRRASPRGLKQSTKCGSKYVNFYSHKSFQEAQKKKKDSLYSQLTNGFIPAHSLGMSSSHVLIIGYSRQPEVGMGEFYNMGRVK